MIGRPFDRLEFDLRWSAAAGLTVAPAGFHPTVLVGLPNRARASGRPRRLLQDVNVAAKVAGLLRSRVRVLDSTPCWRRLTSMDCTSSSSTAGLMLNAGSRRDRIALSAGTGVLGKACVLFSWTLIRSIW